MRLFNFNLTAVTYDTGAALEVITQGVSDHDAHGTNPAAAGFITLYDDLLVEETDDEGHYGLSQDSTSLTTSGGVFQAFSVTLSAKPDGVGGSNDVAADILLISNAVHRG